MLRTGRTFSSDRSPSNVNVKIVGMEVKDGAEVGWPEDMVVPKQRTDEKIQAWNASVFKELKATHSHTLIYIDQAMHHLLEKDSDVEDGTTLYVQDPKPSTMVSKSMHFVIGKELLRKLLNHRITKRLLRQVQSFRNPSQCSMKARASRWRWRCSRSSSGQRRIMRMLTS